MQNGLKPEHKFQLYALMTVVKYAYDRTIWSKWFGSSDEHNFTDRQQVIFSEALRAMKEFEEELVRTGRDKNVYKVPQIPFRY